MISRRDVENTNLRKSEDLAKLAEMLGYGRSFGQLQCNNGAFISSLLDFFDDNPGAMMAIQDWILENYDFEESENESKDE